jgi:hypothetical protein
MKLRPLLPAWRITFGSSVGSQLRLAARPLDQLDHREQPHEEIDEFYRVLCFHFH